MKPNKRIRQIYTKNQSLTNQTWDITFMTTTYQTVNNQPNNYKAIRYS